MGNAAEYFKFFKWKSKILACLCIFYKNSWVENKDTFTYHFALGWKENSLKIDWDPVELSGKTAMISTKPRPPQNYYLFWIEILLESRRLIAEQMYFLSVLSVKCSGQMNFLRIR